MLQCRVLTDHAAREMVKSNPKHTMDQSQVVLGDDEMYFWAQVMPTVLNADDEVDPLAHVASRPVGISVNPSEGFLRQLLAEMNLITHHINTQIQVGNDDVDRNIVFIQASDSNSEEGTVTFNIALDELNDVDDGSDSDDSDDEDSDLEKNE